MTIAHALRHAREALRSMNGKKHHVLAASLLDASYLFLHGLVSAAVLSKIMDYVVAIGAALSRRAASDPSSTEDFWGMLAATRSIKPFLLLILLFGILVVFSYGLYIIFQGSSWWLSRKIMGHGGQNNDSHLSHQEYLVRFAKASLPWLAAIIAGSVLSYLLSLAATLRTGAVPSATSPLMMTLFILLLYFSSISYALLHRYPAWKLIKTSLHLGIRRSHHALPHLAVLAVLSLAIHGILVLAGRVHPILFFTLGAVLVFPSLTFARIYLSRIVNDIYDVKLADRDG